MTPWTPTPQEAASSYKTTYVNEQRRRECRHQAELLAAYPDPILEVGPGPGLTARQLRDSGKTVRTIDLDPELEPTIVSSIHQLPFADDAFPTVAAFEVLEHVPPEYAITGLRELCRVASENVIVSVPEKEDKLKTYVSTHILGRSWDVSNHYWELGYRLSLLKLLSVANTAGYTLAGWDATHGWHRFLRFRKASGDEPPAILNWLRCLTSERVGAFSPGAGSPQATAECAGLFTD